MAVLKARSYSLCHFDCSFQPFKGLETSKSCNLVNTLCKKQRIVAVYGNLLATVFPLVLGLPSLFVNRP